MSVTLNGQPTTWELLPKVSDYLSCPAFTAVRSLQYRDYPHLLIPIDRMISGKEYVIIIRVKWPGIIPPGREATRCQEYYQGGSLRQVVRAYQLASAKYKIKPVTIKYNTGGYGAQIQYMKTLRNGKRQVKMVLGFNPTRSEYPHSSSQVILCHDLDRIPASSGILSYEFLKDGEEISPWLDQIDQIGQLVAKKYPSFPIYELGDPKH